MGANWGYRTVYAFGCVWGLIGLFASAAIAQITPDETLGNERSRVTRGVNIRGGNADRIDGGARRGGNLFHSFSEFNVNEGQRVYFANPSGIENILSRVTGRDVSDILGTLGVDGGANLFLLNPNGIIFGPNARLDVSGSFTASTANSFTFANGSVFSATNPGDASLLTMSAPLGVQYGTGQRGDITLNGAIISQSNGSSIAMLATNRFNMTGGARLSTSVFDGNAGDIYIVANAVNLDNTRVDGNDTRVSVISSNVESGNGNGGLIYIQTNSLVLRNGAQIQSILRGRGQAGTIDINASNGRVILDGTGLNLESLGLSIVPRIIPSAILTNIEASGRGRGGRINIDTNSLTLRNGAQIQSVLKGRGQAGRIDIDAPNGTVRLDGIGLILDARGVQDTSSAIFTTVEGGIGRGGQIDITAGSLSLTNGAQLLASVREQARGNAGRITIHASDTVRLSGIANALNQNGELEPLSSAIFTSLTPGVSGIDGERAQGGKIEINADRLIMNDGGRLFASTSGRGNAGRINLRANTISLDGGTTNIFSNVESGGVGNAGVIDIDTDAIGLTNGAQIQSLVRGPSASLPAGRGDAGKIDIDANDAVRLDGTGIDISGTLVGSALFTSIEADASGAGGDIEVTTPLLEIRNRANLNADAQGLGRAGNIRLNADRISLNEGFLRARTTAAGGGGEITLQGRGDDGQGLDLVLMRNGSLISAQAFNDADGGNVRIIAQDDNAQNGFVIAQPLENNDIIASAEQGTGGNINITTNAIFGLEERDPLTPLSDINASSEFGREGEIVLNTLGIDPSRTPGELPIETVDAASLVAEGCLGRNRAGVDEQGEFRRTGRGGISRSPSEALSGETTTPPLASLDDEKPQAHGSIPPDTSIELLIEAQRLRRNANGKISLVADRSPAAPAPTTPADLCPPDSP